MLHSCTEIKIFTTQSHSCSVQLWHMALHMQFFHGVRHTAYRTAGVKRLTETNMTVSESYCPLGSYVQFTATRHHKEISAKQKSFL